MNLYPKTCIATCSLFFGFSAAAFARGTFVSNVSSSQGEALTFALPLEAPVAGVALGGIVCAKQEKVISEAKLYMDHGNGQGHGGPKITLRPVSKNCSQLNALNFPHTGEWQIQLKFADGDAATFDFNVEEALEDGTFLAGSSEGTFGVLVFPKVPLTLDSTSALFCTNALSPAQVAQLWMPDMGHGSSATELAAHSPFCSEVNKIDFFMGGAWEVHTSLENGEKLTFKLSVKE